MCQEIFLRRRKYEVGVMHSVSARAEGSYGVMSAPANRIYDIMISRQIDDSNANP